MQQNSFDQIDVLHHVEKAAEAANRKMKSANRDAFSRYPIMFMLLVVFGIVALDEGIKGIFEDLGLSVHPGYLLIGGLIILILTGTIFKKLNEFHVEK